MKLSLIIPSALALVAACATPLAFTVDPSFPPPDVEGIARAATEWNEVTGPDPDLKITLHGGKWRIERAVPPGGWNGICDRSERLIQIHPKTPGSSPYAVAKHEMGHALGMRHPCWIPGINGGQTGPDHGEPACDPARSHGVMDPSHVTTEISAEDMAECRRAGACK